MTERPDVATIFREAPVCKLQGSYQGRMLERIIEAFNTEEQELFVASFYCYLSHDPNELVVDLDGVWEWLGYSQKVNCKRKLQHTFVEGSDFVVRCGIKETNGRGGHNRERIVMTIETFKAMCLLSETAKGAAVRKYYMKLEKILHTVLEEQTAELALQLKAETAKVSHLQKRVEHIDRRTRALNVKGQVVYICGDDDPTRHKIGKADDSVKYREATGGTFNPSLMMRHAVPCVDARLLEEVVFHRLRDRRICSARTGNKTEWFTISLGDAIAAVEDAQDWLDENIEGNDSEEDLVTDVIDNPTQLVTPEHHEIRRRLRLTKAEQLSSRAAVNQSHAAYMTLESHIKDMQQSIDSLVGRLAPTSAMPAPQQPQSTVKFTIPDKQKKRVVQYTIEGQFVRAWDTATQAANSGLFGDSRGVFPNIRGAARGEAAHAKGFVWREETAIIEREVEYRTDGDYKQFRLDGSLVTTYTSLAKAAKAAGADYYKVRNIFTKDKYKGYKWVTDKIIDDLAPRPRRVRNEGS